jgi:hypothetical protein
MIHEGFVRSGRQAMGHRRIHPQFQLDVIIGEADSL